MSFRWTAEELRDRGVTLAEGFNRELQEQLSGLASIDRDQIPHDSVTEDMVIAGAAHELVPAQQNTEIASPYRNTAGDLFTNEPAFYSPPGLSYNQYSGEPVIAFTETVTTRGGLVQVEFSAWVWKNSYEDDSGTSDVAIRHRFRLVVNGQEVDSTAATAQPWQNIHLVGNAVAPEGSSVVQVEWTLDPQDNNKSISNNFVLFYFGGAALLVQNRRA